MGFILLGSGIVLERESDFLKNQRGKVAIFKDGGRRWKVARWSQRTWWFVQKERTRSLLTGTSRRTMSDCSYRTAYYTPRFRFRTEGILQTYLPYSRLDMCSRGGILKMASN